MKLINKKILIVLAFLAVIFLSSCSNVEQGRTHRLQWWVEAINWDSQSRINNLSGKDVLVAVIDTAIDETHPDLDGKIIDKYVTKDVKNEKRMEHGTAVAGIICASPNDENGVLGIATEAKILSIVISENNEAKVDALIEGVEYAIEKDVDIINISATMLQNDSKLEQAINDAYNKGIIIVAAAGNNLYGVNTYPAAYENVISVNSVDSKGSKIYTGGTESVYLPGGNIVTTYSSIYESKKYVSYSGTSMSAPMLTGVIALILERNPGIANVDVIEYFKNYHSLKFDTLSILKDFDKLYKGN